MQHAVGGYALQRDRLRESAWQTPAGGAWVALAIASAVLLTAVGAVALTSDGAPVGHNVRHARVVGGQVVAPPAPAERTIAGPALVDGTRSPTSADR